MSWVYLGVASITAYVLAMIFIVPDTGSARLGITVLFVCWAVSYSFYSVLLWKER